LRVVAGTDSTYDAIEKTIIFPSNWNFQLNHHAAEFEEYTIDTLKRFQIITSAAEEQHVRHMGISAYSGYSFPNESENVYLGKLFSLYITHWLNWDDAEVEMTENGIQDFDDVFKALRGEDVNTDNRHVQVWSYIAKQFIELGVSNSWLQRLSNGMRQWVVYSLQETERSKNQDIGSLYTYDDYENTRMVSIGMIVTAQLLELSIGIDLAELSKREEFQKLLKYSSQIVAYVNEMFSISKDIMMSWCNLVVVYRNLYSTTLDETIDRLMEMLHQAIGLFDEYAGRLIRIAELKYPKIDISKLKLWVEVLRRCSGGFAYWHGTCDRFRRYAVLTENDERVFFNVHNNSPRALMQ
jgi:hypothetical protein